MKRLLFFIVFCVLFTTQSFAQTRTEFEQGELLVVGTNYLNRQNECASNDNDPHYDNIFLVSTKDIVNGTQIVITDNRYKGDNNFEKTEGAYQLERVGGTISRGTVFRIDITSASIVAGSNGSVLNGWKLVNRSNSFGLNNNGDQFFILQGSGWSNPQFWNNKSVLTGYNSKNVWSSTANAENSLLPNSPNQNYNIENYHFTPVDIHKLYRFYNGSMAKASKNEWAIRLLNPSNWKSFDTTNKERPINCENLIDHSNNYSFFQIKDYYELSPICVNDSIQITIPKDNEENSIQTEFQWYVSTFPTNIGGTPITGQNTRTLNYAPSTNDTYYFYCNITYKLSWKSSEGDITSSNTLPSAYYKVTVNPKPITSPINKID